MDDLLREAIADAKAVRETALANAKIALEEAFTPRLQSMLSKKIATESEMEDEMEAPEEGEEMEDGHEMGHEESEIEDEHEMEADEMDAPEEGEEMEDDHDVEDGEERNESENEDGEEIEDSEQEERNESEVEDDHDVEDGEERNEEEEMEDEDDLDLNSVLAELEADLNEDEEVEDDKEIDESEKSDKDEEEKVEENDVSSDIGKSDNKVNPEANDSSKTGAQGPEGEGSDKESGKEDDNTEVVDDLTEDLDLDEVLKALTEEEEEEDKDAEVESLQKEIKEYRKVVNFMRKNLNEVNLLNAKLLFSNKLFRAFGLNNNQKLKVVETFDRTTNLREVKLVYATLAESFKRPTSKIVESKGSSSKVVRSTKPVKEVLSEGQEMKNRFKKLANIL